MKVRAKLTTRGGFKPPLPGYASTVYLEGELVGNDVVVPPGPSMANVTALGFKKPPYLIIPRHGGLFEWAACEEDPTPALLGQVPAPAPVAKGKGKAAQEA